MSIVGPSPGLIPQNEPDLADVLDALRRNIMLDINACHIGQIKVFNPLLQQATVQLVYTQSLFQLPIPGSGLGSYQVTPFPYPLLINIPVYFASGGQSCLTMPVAPGDECLVLFNDRDFSNWYSSGLTGGMNPTMRLHSFSDAIALVGLRSMPKAIQSFDPLRANLRSGLTTRVAAGPLDASLEYGPLGAPTALVTVTAAGPAMSGTGGATLGAVGGLINLANNSGSLGTGIDSLINALNTLATAQASQFTAMAAACTGPLAPLAAGFTALAAANTTAASSLAAVETSLGGLLL